MTRRAGATTLALRVDVDTRQGLHDGVPRLLELFRRLEVRASFFVTMGPDRSGLALRRAWRPGFVAKMWRTRAWRLYGPRTLFAGTLLPARPVGAGAPHLLRQIMGEGHELAPHGFDHVGWQDHVHRLGLAGARADLAAAVAAFREAVGTAPLASAAPGWRTTPAALVAQEEFGYRYASDVRGPAPFRAAINGKMLTTVQVPTTMPTVDELLGRVGDLDGALEAALRPGLNVFTLHAEIEGGPWLDVVARLLQRQRRRRVRLTTVSDGARPWLEAPDALPVLPVGRGLVPGRSGWVAVGVAS